MRTLFVFPTHLKAHEAMMRVYEAIKGVKVNESRLLLTHENGDTVQYASVTCKEDEYRFSGCEFDFVLQEGVKSSYLQSLERRVVR